MGSTNHGAQDITYTYFENATAEDFNKRNLNIRPRGIYSGGYLTRVSDVEVTLSTLAAEIGDDDEQISVQTAAAATLNVSTLDSGSIAEATPYLLLRWNFLAQKDNYVEVHAIASVSAAQANDIIIGKCVFTGATLSSFDYADRTFLNVQDKFLKVEVNSGLYVWMRAGRIQNSSGYIQVPEQRVGPFSVPGSPNSRIDLVYITTGGSIAILQGTAAVSPSAPSYGGKLGIAEVTVVNGDTSIPASRIRDVRSFLTGGIGYDGTSIKTDGGGNLSVGNILGDWDARSNNTVYLAATDGFVVGSSGSAGVVVEVLTDASNPPTTFRSRMSQSTNAPSLSMFGSPVKKGHYWKTNNAQTVWWISIGS